MERPADLPPASEDPTPDDAIPIPADQGDLPIVTIPTTGRRLHAFLRSFVYAYYGILEVLATQRNMIVHFIIAIPTLLATQLLGFSPTENVIVLLCVALVLACEAINTSIERLGDCLSSDYHPAIRCAKDAGAAMVLISAAGAAAVGIILFTSQQRLQRLLRWDVQWEWGGAIDSVMVKLMFLGICWVFVHAWIYRHLTARTRDMRAAARWKRRHEPARNAPAPRRTDPFEARED